MLLHFYYGDIYRIAIVMKAETDIITIIRTSLIGWAVTQVYVKIFKTDVTVIIGNVIMCLTSHWPIIYRI
jgi:hypothetical protein